MRNAAFRDIIFDWADEILNTVGKYAVTIIWTGQNGPRPLPPYVSLEYIANRDIGQPWFAYVKTTVPLPSGTQQIVQKADTTIAIHGYGVDSEAMLEDLKESLKMSTVSDILRAKGVIIRNVMDIKDTGELLDNTNESRWTMDIVFGSTQITIDTPGYIGDVEITEEITAP